MNLNDREKLVQKKLREDIEIPEVVTDKIQNAYQQIKNQKPLTHTSDRFMKIAARSCGAAAAALAVGFIVCVTNPVMARELPLVGGLFEKLQNEVSFFGNFADKATVLEEPPVEMNVADAADTASSDTADSEGLDADKAPASDGLYTKTADGLTITFSEVYANEQAIYLTMLAQSEEPFPDTMMSQTDNGSERPVLTLEYLKNYSFMDAAQNENCSMGFANLEGMFLDENTYSCILRIDLDSDTTDMTEYNLKNEELSQEILDSMGITYEDMNDETEEGYALLSQYMDELSSRQGALKDYIKKIELPESFTLTLDITRLVGDKAEPEYWDSGYTAEELAAMSDKEWQEVMAQEPAEYREYPNQYQNYWYEGGWSFEIPVTIDTAQTEVLELNETNADGIGLEKVVKTPYEITVYDKYEEGAYSDTFLVALDANGNKLPYNDSNGSCDNFAIQDRDISTVDIYILDYTQYMDELKGEERYNNNETKPEEEKWSTLLDANALYHKTVHFETAN